MGPEFQTRIKEYGLSDAMARIQAEINHTARNGLGTLASREAYQANHNPGAGPALRLAHKYGAELLSVGSDHKLIRDFLRENGLTAEVIITRFGCRFTSQRADG